MMLELAVMCLSLNIYYEARNQPLRGQMAVAEVVLNCVADDRFPDTICEVVMEGPTYSWKPDFPVRHRCQFSWYCDGKSDVVYNLTGWEDAVIAAYLAYNGYGEDRVDGALYYYAHKRIAMPKWAKDMTVTAVLEGHTYLK